MATAARPPAAGGAGTGSCQLLDHVTLTAHCTRRVWLQATCWSLPSILSLPAAWCRSWPPSTGQGSAPTPASWAACQVRCWLLCLRRRIAHGGWTTGLTQVPAVCSCRALSGPPHAALPATIIAATSHLTPSPCAGSIVRIVLEFTLPKDGGLVAWGTYALWYGGWLWQLHVALISHGQQAAASPCPAALCRPTGEAASSLDWGTRHAIGLATHVWVWACSVSAAGGAPLLPCCRPGPARPAGLHGDHPALSSTRRRGVEPGAGGECNPPPSAALLHPDLVGGCPSAHARGRRCLSCSCTTST
jgi:hypothetical protein